VAPMVQHLVRFLQVGGIAFALDAGILWFLVYQIGVPPIVARGFSFLITIAVTFVLNARYTFAASIKDSSKSRYVLIQCVGSAINFAVYSALVLAGLLGPLWALVVGSFLGSAHNFLMMRRFVFANATGRPPA
jgi:putative flippase GtrA